MSVPASPFVGRLLAEIAKHAGGLPAVAAAIGVTPQVIDALANGGTISAAELDVMHEWLAARVRLTPEETEDYGRLCAAAFRPALGEIQSPPTGGQPRPEPAPEGPRSSAARKVGVVAVATVGAVLIVVLTVVITITIIRPGSVGSSEAKASTSPSATSAAPVPDTPSPTASALAPMPSPSSSSPPPPFATAASSPGAGKLIGSYNNFKLSYGYEISFASGGAPQPDTNLTADLYNNDGGNFITYNGGALALISGSLTTYASCKADTALGGSLSSVAQGDSICFQGHGVIAAAYVVGYATSGGVDYVTLDVRIWRDPSTDQTGSGLPGSASVDGERTNLGSSGSIELALTCVR